MKTFHASPERSSREVLDSQFLSLSENDFFTQLINGLPYIVTVLNSNRQIVYSNQVLIDNLIISDFRELLGKRVGEALHCKHATDMEGGCGTSENCRVCGAVNTITRSFKEDRKIVNECRITTCIDGVEEYYDYEVTASPFNWQGEKYTVFSVADISGIKRKRILERIFFHDILNTAGNMKNLSELLIELDDPKRKEEILVLLGRVSGELVEEIQEQRQLSAAESGELNLSYTLINTSEILGSLILEFEHNTKKTINFSIAEDSQTLRFSSDKILLTRILKNMIKNAIEASSVGDTITIKACLEETHVHFSVHNPRVIDRIVQLQIFKRSFSTKGIDRGLGTYSMKLLGERYLKGKVHFSSDKEFRNGVLFRFTTRLGSRKSGVRSREKYFRY